MNFLQKSLAKAQTAVAAKGGAGSDVAARLDTAQVNAAVKAERTQKIEKAVTGIAAAAVTTAVLVAAGKAGMKKPSNPVPVGVQPEVLRQSPDDAPDLEVTKPVVTPPMYTPMVFIDRSAETPQAYEVAGKVWAPGTRVHGMPKTSQPARPRPVADSVPSRPTLTLEKPVLNTNRDRSPVKELTAALAPKATLSVSPTDSKWLPLLLLAGAVVVVLYVARKTK